MHSTCKARSRIYGLSVAFGCCEFLQHQHLCVRSKAHARIFLFSEIDDAEHHFKGIICGGRREIRSARIARAIVLVQHVNCVNAFARIVSSNSISLLLFWISFLNFVLFGNAHRQQIDNWVFVWHTSRILLTGTKRKKKLAEPVLCAVSLCRCGDVEMSKLRVK